MPRATIPYFELDERLEKMYPDPVFRGVYVVRSRFSEGFTPKRVYDRSTGNYAPIGWRCMVNMSAFTGSYDDAMNPVFVQRRFETVILLAA